MNIIQEIFENIELAKKLFENQKHLQYVFKIETLAERSICLSNCYTFPKELLSQNKFQLEHTGFGVLEITCITNSYKKMLRVHNVLFDQIKVINFENFDDLNNYFRVHYSAIYQNLKRRILETL